MPSLSPLFQKDQLFYRAAWSQHTRSRRHYQQTDAQRGNRRSAYEPPPMYEYWANQEHSLRPFHRPALRRRNCRYRLEMHSMNWLNVAAFNSVDIDFDVGRKFL